MGRRDIPFLITKEEAVEFFDVDIDEVEKLSPVGTLFNPKQPGVALYASREVQEIARRS